MLQQRYRLRSLPMPPLLDLKRLRYYVCVRVFGGRGKMSARARVFLASLSCVCVYARVRCNVHPNNYNYTLTTNTHVHAHSNSQNAGYATLTASTARASTAHTARASTASTAHTSSSWLTPRVPSATQKRTMPRHSGNSHRTPVMCVPSPHAHVVPV